MTPNDLVLTPEGWLAYVQDVGGEQVRVKYANTETVGLYPKATRLPVVARAADLDKARAAAATSAPAPKEG